MKLNKMELNALDAKIVDTLQDLANKEQKALNVVSDKANLKRAKRIHAEIAAITPDTKKILHTCGRSYAFNHDLTIETIIKELRPKQSKVLPARYQDIFCALVVAQIDCPDVQSMIDRVTKQFVI